MGTSLSTIGFSTYHKLRNGEQLVYKPNSQKVVGGLSTNATYFAEIVDATTIKLHDTLGEAIAGINTVTLSFHGIGRHTLECTSQKSVIDSINIVDNGSGYENKKDLSLPQELTHLQTSLQLKIMIISRESCYDIRLERVPLVD